MFQDLKSLPADAIIGIMALFRADEDSRKVDLSVGVYQDETGRTPVLACVKEAEKRIFEHEDTKSYIAIAGNAGFNRGVAALLFGTDSSLVADGRVATLQAPGGSGALSVAGHLIQRARPGTSVYLSDPSWPNHKPLLTLSGLTLRDYPYYDQASHRIDFDAMMAVFETIPAGDVLLLHGCCHNPCGCDLSHEQWEAVGALCARRGIVPFVDFAYQGLAEGLEEDAFGVRILAETVPEFILVSSFSKNLGLYRERVGAVSVVCENAGARDAVFSNLSNVARSIYSMPPDHGAAIVDCIFHDARLRALWHEELARMRNRLNGLRRDFVERLTARATSTDFSFIAHERGLFSFLGLSREQIVRLREEFHIYMVESSRINVAGINDANIEYVADSIAAVAG